MSMSMQEQVEFDTLKKRVMELEITREAHDKRLTKMERNGHDPATLPEHQTPTTAAPVLPLGASSVMDVAPPALLRQKKKARAN